MAVLEVLHLRGLSSSKIKDHSVYKTIIRSGELGPLQVSYTSLHWKRVFKSAVLQLKGRVVSINSFGHSPEADKASSRNLSPLGSSSSVFKSVFSVCVSVVLIWKQSA